MNKSRNALTLVELLIASSISLVVLLAVVSAFHTGIFSYRSIDEALALHQGARQILERMDADIRNSFAYSKDEAKFTGDAAKINFLTCVDTFSRDGIIRDYASVSYELNGARLTRLCRKGKDSLNSASQTEPDEMASSVEEFSLSYGYIEETGGQLAWKDLWDEPNALPVAVKVRISLKEKSAAAFERTIYLALAG